MSEPGLPAAIRPLRHRLGEEVGAAEVEVGDGVEVRGRGRRLAGAWRARPALLTRMSKGPCAATAAAVAVDVADVERQRLGREALGADRRDRLVELLRRARREHHLRPLLGQRDGAAEADAGRGAGDERAAAVEAERGGARQLHGSSLYSAASRRQRRGAVGDVAAAVAADADVGLLGVADEALEHAEPRAVLADHRRRLVGQRPSGSCGSSGTCRPRARRCSGRPSWSAACGWCRSPCRRWRRWCAARGTARRSECMFSRNQSSRSVITCTCSEAMSLATSSISS